MNRTALLAAFAVCIAASAHAADKREDRTVSGFHAISMGAVMDLQVVQDGSESLTLEGDAETLARIETVVQDGTLRFKYKREPGTFTTHGRVRGTVHARDLDAIALSGAGNVRSAELKGDALKLAISGSGDMDIGRLTARQANVTISGSGNMSLAGKADALNARISGSGDIKATKLETDRADVSIAGAGSATVWAKQQLVTTVSGVGNVRYYGDPQVTKSVRGVGHVERVAANP